MRAFSTFILPVVLLSLLWSCRVNKENDNDIVIDVNDEFRIQMLEDLRTPEDDLIFQLESIKNRECEKDTVVFDINNFGNAMTININVQNSGFPCDLGVSRVGTQASTGAISNIRLPLSIRLEELVSNQGDLLSDETSYQLAMETTYGFYLPYDKLQKVPSDMVWGYVAFTPFFNSVAEEFIAKLESLTQESEVASGNYGYFEVDNNNELSVLEEEGEVFNTTAFLRGFDIGDSRRLQSLINDYQQNYPGMRFFMRDSFGNILSE